MRLNKNMYSLNIHYGYKQNLVKNSTALERISTGSKINSAKDNPIKLGQSENIRIQLRGLQVSERNLQDGISMIQTADSAMGNITDVLIRMRELTVQAANGTNNEEDKKAIQNEIEQLKDHIDKTAKNTEFNGNKLLDAEDVADNNNPTYKDMQGGANVNDSMKIPQFNLSAKVLNIDKIDVVGDSNGALELIDKAISTVNGARSRYGALQQRMETSANNLSQSSYTLEKADSEIIDVDIALEMANLTKTNILVEAATAIMKQTNNFPSDVLRILENIR
jgi:flagellin